MNDFKPTSVSRKYGIKNHLCGLVISSAEGIFLFLLIYLFFSFEK